MVNPKRRDVNAVLEDVRDGFVSLEAAGANLWCGYKEYIDDEYVLENTKTKKLRGKSNNGLSYRH